MATMGSEQIAVTIDAKVRGTIRVATLLAFSIGVGVD